MSAIFQKIIFILKFRYYIRLVSLIRTRWYKIQGMKIAKFTQMPRVYVNWPHQVSIGQNCKLEHDVYLKYDGIWEKGTAIDIKDNVFIGSGVEFNIKSGITIGNDTLIASGCRFIDHDHGIAPNQLMRIQNCPKSEIIIGSDVWLGCNVVVLKGVNVGDGAIVAAGAVLTKSVPSNEIWGGIPAKKISERR